MRAIMINALLMSLSRGRSGVPLAHGFGKLGGTSASWVRTSPINSMLCHRSSYPSTSTMLAFAAFQSKSSHHTSRGISTTPLATIPVPQSNNMMTSNKLPLQSRRSLPSVVAFASLRDLLESSGKEKNDTAAAAGDNSKKDPNVGASSTTSATTTLSPPKTPQVDAITISDTYDSGNGEFVSARILDEDCDLQVNVKVRPDPYTYLENKNHFQYFSFRSTLNRNSPAIKGIFSGQKSIRVKYVLENAGDCSYADAFNGYSTFVTTKSTPFDPDSWSRTMDSSYKNGCLTWSHVHELGGSGAASAYFAYFPPYSYERHLGLIAKCAEAKGCSVKSLGQTISGREIDCVTVGTGPRICWIIHRQHPGESMAEFYAEGLLNRLLGLDDKWDKVAEKAREMYTFNIVPNINPDGSASGYLRTNAVGSNLNREWCPSPAPLEEGADDDAEASMYEAPTLERSPEVYHLLRHMDETGCDAFLDIHGDEALPFNFLAGSQGMSVWGKRLESLHGAFLASYERANPDMQAKISYEPDEPGKGMPNICSNQIAQRFDCFSGTLEMPFKESWNDTTKAGGIGNKNGWGPERARQLGASVLDALCYVSPFLREEGEFWESLPDEDAYVHPTEKY